VPISFSLLVFFGFLVFFLAGRASFLVVLTAYERSRVESTRVFAVAAIQGAPSPAEREERNGQTAPRQGERVSVGGYFVGRRRRAPDGFSACEGKKEEGTRAG